MKYIITLSNEHGAMLEETLDLPVEDSITWADFVQLRLVKDLILTNPSMQIIDVTPEGMPDTFTSEQMLANSLKQQGLRKGQNVLGQTTYQEE